MGENSFVLYLLEFNMFVSTLLVQGRYCYNISQ